MSSIKLNLKGFEKMLDQIQSAGGNVDEAATKAINESAKAVQEELRYQCSLAGVPSSVSNEIRAETSRDGNRIRAEVGWKLGSYDPANPSAGYKAVLLNYGAPSKKSGKSVREVKTEKIRYKVDGNSFKTLGTSRGRIEGKGFIAEARDKATPQVKKIQSKTLKEILKGLA